MELGRDVVLRRYFKGMLACKPGHVETSKLTGCMFACSGNADDAAQRHMAGDH